MWPQNALPMTTAGKLELIIELSKNYVCIGRLYGWEIYKAVEPVFSREDVVRLLSE